MQGEIEMPKGGNETLNAAARVTDKKIEMSSSELEAEMRKRLINFDVNPGGDI